MRLSNFLLYQCAYAEFLFVPEFWPDFDAGGLCAGARDVFRHATRRFGKVVKPGRPRNEKGIGDRYMQKRVITGLLASAYVVTMILLWINSGS